MNRKLDIVISSLMKRKLKKLKKREPQLYTKVLKAIELIREEPYVGDSKAGDLKGIFSMDIRYKRTGYELAYILKENEDGEYVLVLLFGTRENFYKELKRYLYK